MGTGAKTTIKRTGNGAVGAADREAWHRRASGLYEELRRPAIGLVRKAYGPALRDDEIEDVYSNAWLGTLRALERRHAELSDEEIRSYLLTAVANHASKELRRRRRKPVAPLEAAGSVAGTGASPEERAASAETSQIARDVLSSLPPRRRAVMLLRYGWGLEPKEVCGMVEGLSPRAYRKEITKGVDELATKIRQVEDGSWCAEREALLKSYASGLADEDQVLQAEHHIAHCRHCHDFVAKLSGHLHEIGSVAMLPASIELADRGAPLGERIASALHDARDAAGATASRAEVGEGVQLATGARGAGAAGAGVLAKIAGLGAAGKAALACLGAGALTTACVVSGIVPGADGPVERSPDRAERATSVPRIVPRFEPQPRHRESSRAAAREPKRRDESQRAAAQESVSPAVSPSTPPVEQEFGVASAAPAPSPAAAPGGAASSQDVQQEFGP